MRLPGRKEGGLLPTQRHIAIAASRALKKHKSAIIAAEQGTGKSLTACGVLEVLHAYPAIVLCPPHLIHKWVSEIERGVPGAVARVINCIERGEDGSDGLEDSERSKLSEPSQLSQRAKRYSIMDFVRDYRAGKLGARAVAVVSRERAKLGSGWAPVAITRKVWDRESHAWVSYLADPDTGQILLGEDDVPLIDSSAAWRWLAVKQRFAITEPVQGWTVSDADDKGKLPRRTGEWGQRQARTPLFTQGQGIGSLQNVPMCSVDGQWLQPRVVEHPEARVGFRRYPIASFIHRKLKGFFKLLIGDEMHQYQAPRSDQAIAFHQISRACKWTLGLSATIFGGKSTSLYHLLHRTSGEMRNDYGVHDERRWAQAFGVLEVTRWRGAGTGSEGKDAEDGAFSGYGRERTVVRELPGISPAVIRYLLPHTVFARIADLGYRLPPYREQVVRLDMDLAQREQYWERVYDPRMGGGRLYTLMKQALKEGDHSLLSVWLQTALARPNSCFRADEVLRLSRCLPNEAAEQIDLTMAGQRRNLLKRAAQHVLMMTLDPVVRDDQWLPKERWLIDYCREQIEQGRKVLVYVRQTGTRDIQPRIVTALKSAMIRARVLPANLKPEHREAWVQSNTSGMDVLVVNPQKVDTGLDLIMFHSIVWYELQYSLYVMWQAMRRVWRLGQTKPVEVIWLSYRSTLEDLALSLMGKKLYAAQLLYGDEVGGAIVESDDGSFLTELARAAMDKAQVEDLSQLFAGVSQGQHDEAVEGSVETLSTVPAPTPEPIRTLPPVAVPISPLAAAVTMEAMRSSVMTTQFGLVNRRPKSRVKPLALAVQSPLIGEAMGEALVQLGLSLDV